MSSDYFARLLNEEEIATLSLMLDSDDDLLSEELYSGDDILIGATTDYWIYSSCNAYLFECDVFKSMTDSDFYNKLSKKCFECELYINSKDMPMIINRIKELDLSRSTLIPYFTEQLGQFDKTGYIEELEGIFEDEYLYFFTSFMEILDDACKKNLNLLIMQ